MSMAKYPQLQWSQDFMRICPQKENRRQNKTKEISAANFSTGKMSLFLGILTESQFFRSLHFCMNQVRTGEKPGLIQE